MNEDRMASICREIVAPAASASADDYLALLHRVQGAGLFRRTLLPYAIVASVGVAGLLLCLYGITRTDNLLLQLLNGLMFGFWSVQLGMLGHDLSHGQVFSSATWNKRLAIIEWCLVGGLSERRWFAKHNAHHRAPNHEGMDPDLEIPFVLDHRLAQDRSRFFQTFILPRQHILFWCVLPLVYFWNIAHSFRYLLHRPDRQTTVEVTLLSIHFLLLFLFVFSQLSVATGLVFLSSVSVSVGVYMSLVFAPNHKGMEIVSQRSRFIWTQQICCTRNIRCGPLGAFLLGGLHHQIEHHLFPTMSRFKQRRASQYVREFCREHRLPYHQTSWSRSLRELQDSLVDAASADHLVARRVHEN